MNSIFKRALSILLVFVMCISMLPASALAENAAETEEIIETAEIPKEELAEEPEGDESLLQAAELDSNPSEVELPDDPLSPSTQDEQGEITATIGDVSAKAEDTVDVTVAIAGDCTNLCCIQFAFTYDTNVLEPVLAESNGIVDVTTENLSSFWNVVGTALNGKCRITAEALDDQNKATAELDVDSAEFTVQFNVKSDATPGTYSLAFSSDLDNDFCFATQIGDSAYPTNVPDNLLALTSGSIVINTGSHEKTPAVIASGICGDNLTWTLDEDGLLTISGTGDMAEFYRPWESYSTSIKSICVNDGVTSIGGTAFLGCSSLVTVELPDSLVCIGENAFGDCCSLTGIDIPKSVTEFGNCPFIGCSCLENINVSADNVYFSSDGGVLFDKQNTELICFPNGKSGSYTIPDSVKTIGEGAFAGCGNLTNIEVPNGVTVIESSSFDDCVKLKNVVIGNGVTSIGDYAFRNCTGLESITIGDDVAAIGSMAFYACSKLTDVYYSKSSRDWNNISVGSNNNYLTTASFHYGQYVIDYYNGTELLETQMKNSGEAVALSENIPTNTGYYFIGWSESPSATEAQYQPGGGYTDDADISLYAVWTPEPADVALTVGSGRMTSDGRLDVSVALSENSAVTAMQFKLTYDSAKLKLESCEAGEGMQELNPTINAGESSIIYFAWDDITPYQSGEPLLRLVFSAAEGASGTAELTIDRSPKELVFYGVDSNRLNVNTEDGAVEIIPYSTGDVNMDGEINIYDCNLIRRYAAGLIELSDTQKLLANVNGDESINVIDVNLVRRYVVKLIDVFPAQSI